MIKEIQQCINYARIAEQTERYDDMARYSRQVLKLILDNRSAQRKMVRQQQIKLFSNAYRCKISSRRTAWKALQTLQNKQSNSKGRSTLIIQYYKEIIEKQIREICHDVLSLTNTLLNSEKVSMEVRIQLFKVKGDFHRYMCEIVKDADQLKKLQKECEGAYRKGIELIRQEKDIISSYNARRLSLYLNLSVYYYEIMSATTKATEVCQEGFNPALEDISDLQQAKYIDSVTIMQLMHDNITAWKTELSKSKK